MAEDATRPPEEDWDNPSRHTYDGISEYDNPTPLWWDFLFLGTVLFAPLYVLWFHSPVASNLIADKYEASLAANMRAKFGELGTLEPTAETIAQYMEEPEWLAVGQSTFNTHCASCHGQEGAGITGPNLTDEQYLHIKNIEDIGAVVLNGAKAGAMPAWGNRLHPNEVVLVSSYVATLRGQNLPGRPAEGKEIAPWDAEE